MKAIIIKGKIEKFNSIPKSWGNVMGGFDNLSSQELENYGFYDVITPTYDPITQVIHNLHFDDSYDDGISEPRSVFIYDVKDKTISETVAQLKTKKIDALKKLGYDKLQSTDWMVIREAEKGTAIPSATQTERDDIRASVLAKESEINALTTKADILRYDINF